MKKRWKRQGRAAAPEIPVDADPTTRSIALCGTKLAVAAGRRWRVVDFESGTVLHDSSAHEGAVRGVAFSPDGQYLLTCADDKCACVWRTSDWACVHKLKSAKKATACTFSADSQHIFFADRFGDVLVATALPAAAPATAAAAAADASSAPADAADAAGVGQASLLLGHLQSIVSSLVRCGSSTGQQLLVSTDKDCKVRASVLPNDPTKGSYEIQTYCLGHTRFVTSAAAVPQQQQQQRHLLVSGAGDGTVRLWDVDSGEQLCSYVASEQPPPLSFLQQQEEVGGGGAGGDGKQDGGEGADGQGDSDGDEQQQQEEQTGAAAAAAGSAGEQEQEQGAAAAAAADADKASNKGHKVREACCAVLSVAVSPDGSTVAAAVEGQQELQLLSLDAAAGQLQLVQKLALPDVANPAAVAFDSQGRLWAVGGVLARETESAHVGVAAKHAGSEEWAAVTAAALPDALRASLELRVHGEEEKQQQQQEGYYFDGFKKAVYARNEAQAKKRPRRDLKDIERLRALAAAQDQQQQQNQEEGGAAEDA